MSTNKYLELKARHMAELEAFPQCFAFSNSQLEEGLQKLGVSQADIIGTGHGGFIRKADKERYCEMMFRISRESLEAMQDEDYLFQAFAYELANHEYGYTFDDTDTLQSLGLDYDTMTDRQKEILKRAKTEVAEMSIV